VIPTTTGNQISQGSPEKIFKQRRECHEPKRTRDIPHDHTRIYTPQQDSLTLPVSTSHEHIISNDPSATKAAIIVPCAQSARRRRIRTTANVLRIRLETGKSRHPQLRAGISNPCFPSLLTCVGRGEDVIICSDFGTRHASTSTTTTSLKHPASITNNTACKCSPSEFISEWNDASCGRRPSRAESSDPAHWSRRPQWLTESFSRLVHGLLIPSHAANGTTQCQAKYVWTRPIRPSVSLTESTQWTEFAIPSRLS